MDVSPRPSRAFSMVLSRLRISSSTFLAPAREYPPAIGPSCCPKRPSSWRLSQVRADRRHRPRILPPFRRVLPSSRYRFLWAEPPNAFEDELEQHPRHRHLRHLQDHVPGVRLRALRRCFEPLLLQRPGTAMKPPHIFMIGADTYNILYKCPLRQLLALLDSILKWCK